jgi:acyl-CoA hydrolase
MFLTPAIRNLQGSDFLHYVPQHLSQWTKNLLNSSPVDIFWGSCSLPDKNGVISLGPGAVYESEVLRAAKTVILEVNPNIPFSYGATLLRTTDVDFFVDSAFELPEVKPVTPTAIEVEIAKHIAELVRDGSTIQLGIGGIPNAVGKELLQKKDLGIHTEMINDSMMELFLAGVVTGRKKTLWPDKIVGAFAYGTKALYQFIHENPLVELHPASIVNDPYRIGRNHLMTSINTAVEVDLTGQVCSESIGHVELSGVGGASDTHLGAQRSLGGRGIVALKSTGESRNKTKYSKIVSTLKPGAKVSISRNDVDTIVTEYGVAILKGNSVAERARALIKIAAPEYRELLTFQAKEFQYI